MAAVAQVDDTGWLDFDIPGGNMPVSVLRLHSELATHAYTLFVRFPEGWERASSGFYESSEDFIVIDGSLTMNGETYGRGDWVHVPAGTVRATTSSSDGTLTMARFNGPARWVETTEPPRFVPLHHHLAEIAETEPLVSPFGEQDAWLLRDEGGVSSWLMEAPPAGVVSKCGCEFLDLVARRWFWVPKGTPIPHLESLCFCRIFEETEGAE